MTVQPMHIADEHGNTVCGAVGRLWSDTNWDTADSDWSFRRCKGCEAALGANGLEKLNRRREKTRRQAAGHQAGPTTDAE